MFNSTKKYPLNIVFENISEKIFVIDSTKINMNSIRYKLFKDNCTCVSCGVKGDHFKITKFKEEDEIGHFNLFTKNGILMTKDHIVPVSLKGSNSLKNLQTMCTKCNNKKQNNIQVKDLFKGQIKKGEWLSKKCLLTSNTNLKNENVKHIGKQTFNSMMKTAKKNHDKYIKKYMIEKKVNIYVYKDNLPEEVEKAVEANLEIYRYIVANVIDLNIGAKNRTFQGIPTNLVKILLQEEKEKRNLI